MSERKIDIVRYGDAKRAPAGFIPQELEALKLMVEIQVSGRLIHQQEFSPLSQAGSQQGTLPLAAAQ